MNGLIGRTISHYSVLEQIGQGGMSSVFRATDLLGGRPVAIKILSPYIAHEERFQARFEREIKLLRRLQHPHIIPILDFGEGEGLTYIVMPYVGNGTLLDRLQQGPLDPAEGGRIVDQIASALMLAHQNGVIHRDVKPSNVLIDDTGSALLSDFSFARPQDASQNLTGSALIGTPAYMSPEQCRGDPIDARSDQYSFAVMLFQLTTGQLPFSADTPMGTALQHINVPLPRPRLVNPNLPEEVEMVLIKALAKDPALRFESVEAMNTAFQAALQAALHPGREAAANDKTLNGQRTMALYRKYQNVRPPERRGRYERSVVLATLLLLMACTVSAGAVAAIRPDLFSRAAAAGPVSEADIQSTVDAKYATAIAGGTDMPSGELATQIYGTVAAAVEATRIAAGGPSSTPSATPTPTTVGTLGSPGFIPAPTRTLAPGESPPPPSKTPTPSTTPTDGPSPTLEPSTATPLDTDTPQPPTDTPQLPTDTPQPPTDTPQPPTNTPQPPTNTPRPPTNTPRPPPNTPQPPANTPPGGNCSPWPECKKTQTAEAGG